MDVDSVADGKCDVPMTLAAVVTSAAFRKFSYLPRWMPQIAEVRDAVLSGEICILMWPQAPSAVYR